jgi:hypothetical protein
MQRTFQRILFKIIFPSLAIISNLYSYAQTYDCTIQSSVVKIDFGTDSKPADVNLSGLKSYKKNSGSCPQDGQFNFTSYSTNCFDDKWHILSQDHTSNDEAGRMMVVNASERPSTFFMNYITGLTGGNRYELSFWVVNICKYADGCNPTPPIIRASLLDGSKEIARFTTSTIQQTAVPNWKIFYGEFTMPLGVSALTLRMEDITNGGCGNDFAIDDIILKECKKGMPPAEEPIKSMPVIVQKDIVVDIPKAKQKEIQLPQISTIPAPIKPLPRKPLEKNTAVAEKVKLLAPKVIKEETVPIPKLLITRENSLAKKIETDETELTIELYDNGEIDGDTVSIYHNNVLEVNHAGLSLKPIIIKIKVDKANPHHELVMVADNLGSIPPNTSLMIITTASKRRYEVNIASTTQKNAKVIIDLK